MTEVLQYALYAILAFAVMHVIAILWARYGVWRRNGYLTILFVIVAVIDIIILFQVLGGVFVLAFGGIRDISKLDPAILLAANGLAQLIAMLGSAIILTKALGQSTEINFRLQGIPETPLIAYLLAFPTILSAGFFGEQLANIWRATLRSIPSLYQLLDKLEPDTDKIVEQLLHSQSIGILALALVMVAVIPAICEEALFRGFAQVNIERSGFARSRPYLAILITSLGFAAIHLSGFNFPALLVLGLVLGFLAYRTNNLLVGSLAHATNNGIIVLIAFLLPEIFKDERATSLLTSDTQPVAELILPLLLTGLLLAAFLFWFYKITEPLTARHHADLEIAHQNFAYYVEAQDDDL
jgi:uncharacterized protein